jgi:hypothetical protein
MELGPNSNRLNQIRKTMLPNLEEPQMGGGRNW